MIYFCCEEGRRSLVRLHPTLNAVDFLEVVDREEPVEDERQRLLRVYFVKPLNTPGGAAVRGRIGVPPEANAPLARITGGSRFQKITVDSIRVAASGDHLEVHVSPRGDHSLYTLQCVEPDTGKPLKELDPALASVDFSFKVECESDLDCAPPCLCPPSPLESPGLDYLAKDYASFRQLMLDRLAVILPAWSERNPADLGITLVELLAYVGDQLSYRQDAIGTEAYLGTARSRVSVRRHVRLLDYPMHDGCNARAWVQVRLKANAPGGLVVTSPQGVIARPRFVTRLNDSSVLSTAEQERLAGEQPAEVFEPMEEPPLFAAHNEMPFHTWGNDACVLPRGAIRATLRGHYPGLRPGHVLVFKERLGARTGEPADADLTRRQAVRLTRVNGLDAAEQTAARAAGTLPVRVDEIYVPAVPITEIEWSEADALQFPFCLSARTETGGQLLTQISVALGNIILADHGQTLREAEDLGRVPSPDPILAPVQIAGCNRCQESERLGSPVRYRPSLKEGPVTQVSGHDPTGTAFGTRVVDFRNVLPAVLVTDDQGRVWRPKHDLLSSDAFAPEFVLETESDGRATLRFGDDENGMEPGEGTHFSAVYRIGNGMAGNLGAEALVQLAADAVLVPGPGNTFLPQSPVPWIQEVSNPLPAWGGTDPESMEEVRQNAPAAFRTQERAVTPEDYAEKASLHPDVQRAAATLRWTGSWHTVFLTIDRRGGRPVDDVFEAELRRFLERYRMAGQDLEIDGPRFVPLELELHVCVAPDYFQDDVVAELQLAFDNRLHVDGSRGFFHPDNFTFGQPVLMSTIQTRAQRVAGVRHVEVTLLRRQGATTGEAVPADDVFEVGRLEIILLENDPNFPDRGTLRINPVGGR